mgnify:CR=1 FL=1
MRVARADEILGGRIIDGASLHDDPNARIVTNNPEAVCRALGVPYPDAQVVEGEEEGALS